MQRSLPTFLAAACLLAASLPSHALVYQFYTEMSGAAEAPPVASNGTGEAWVTYDTTSRILNVKVSFSDLEGVTTVAHIHSPTAVPGSGTAGVATYPGTFLGFPAGVTSATYEGSWSLDLATSYTASFLNNNGGTPESAAAALLTYLRTGRSYVNVHSEYSRSGEIRGFLAQVPDQGSTLALLTPAALAMALFAMARRQRRS
jgi:hypothetical protein